MGYTHKRKRPLDRGNFGLVEDRIRVSLFCRDRDYRSICNHLFQVFKASNSEIIEVIDELQDIINKEEIWKR